jgi:hypothetical protein
MALPSSHDELGISSGAVLARVALAVKERAKNQDEQKLKNDTKSEYHKLELNDRTGQIDRQVWQPQGQGSTRKGYWQKVLTTGGSDATPPAVRKPRHAGQHNVDEVKHKTNRRGITLCAGFQSGTCTVTWPNNECGKDHSKMHQCEKCLRADHGGKDCNKDLGRIPSTPSGKHKKAGKGNGKGNGERHW